MMIVTWNYKGQIMNDYYITPWFHISKHFKGINIWAWSFQWKGSRAWYNNFKRHSAKKGSKYAMFEKTRLTLRLGKYIISFGMVDKQRYYKDCHVVRVKRRGKTVSLDVEYYINKIPENEEEIELQRELHKLRRKADDYMYCLSRDYPNNSWRN